MFSKSDPSILTIQSPSLLSRDSKRILLPFGENFGCDPVIPKASSFVSWIIRSLVLLGVADRDEFAGVVTGGFFVVTGGVLVFVFVGCVPVSTTTGTSTSLFL